MFGGLQISAINGTADLNDVIVYLFDDGKVTDGTKPVASWSGSNLLGINVRSGVTTIGDIRTELNDASGSWTGRADFQSKFSAAFISITCAAPDSSWKLFHLYLWKCTLHLACARSC